MKKAMVIINGIKFPFFLTDRAVQWAKEERAELYALFLTSGEEMPEAYAFPSDIDLAQNVKDTKDAGNDSLIIMQDQMHFFNNMLKAAGITGFAESMNDPTLEQVLDKIKPADLLFVARDYGEVALLSVTRFSMQDLIDNTRSVVEVINEDKEPKVKEIHHGR